MLAAVQFIAVAVPSAVLCRPPPQIEAPRVPASHVIAAGLAVSAPAAPPRGVATRGFWSFWHRLEVFFQRSMLRGAPIVAFLLLVAMPGVPSSVKKCTSDLSWSRNCEKLFLFVVCAGPRRSGSDLTVCETG
ncbi:unnamed protein product [Durusdinium trenchii]|uniref:Secreted protein n=1 Tax=Durusdinium trenchii TaxID=1381693 RepID=A0ABP0RKS7_9DINO